MWFMTCYGFFSSVKDLKSDKQLIRARAVKHLVRLKGAFPDLLRDTEIITDEGTDYPARLRVDRETWITLIDLLAVEATEYDNFKDAAAAHGIDNNYDLFLHEVWALGRNRLTDLRDRWSR